MNRIHLLLLLSYIVLVFTGCPSPDRITKDQLVGLPEYIHTLKENIRISQKNEQGKGDPPMFALSSTSIKLTTAVIKGQTAVTLGIVPVNMGFTPNFSATETQEVVINLTPLQIGPGNIKITFSDSDKKKTWSENWKVADIVNIGSKNYLWGRNDKNKEVWVDMSNVVLIEDSAQETKQ